MERTYHRTDIKTEPGLLRDKNLKSIHITRGTQNNILLLLPNNHDIRHHILGKLIYQYQHLQNPKKDTENHDKYQKAGIVPNHFKKLKILPFPSQYILSLLNFVTNNRNLFTSNSSVHNIYTRNLDNLHIPSTSLALVQKGVLYTGSKIFNRLPLHVKNTSRDHTLFKNKIKKFLYQHIFYSLDEYYQLQYN